MLTTKQKWNTFMQWLFGAKAIVMDSNAISIAGWITQYEEIYGCLPEDQVKLPRNPLVGVGWWRRLGHKLWDPWNEHHQVPAAWYYGAWFVGMATLTLGTMALWSPPSGWLWPFAVIPPGLFGMLVGWVRRIAHGG